MNINITRKNLKKTSIIVHINKDLSLNISIGPKVTKKELNDFLKKNETKILNLIHKQKISNEVINSLKSNDKILLFGSWLSYSFTFDKEISFNDNTIFLPSSYSNLTKNEIQIKVYNQIGTKYFPQYIKEIENLTNIKCKKYIFTNTVSRWGSFNSKDILRLSLFLTACPIDTVKYVICHELCHKIYMNHSKDFHNLLNKYYNSEIHDPILKSTGKYIRSLKCK